MPAPDPDTIHPLPGHTRCAFIKNIVTRPTIVAGDYSYYDDPDGPERFEEHCVLYHYDFIGDRLVIGRFCAIAANAKFIMNGANHPMDGFSTFPFGIFGGEWQDRFDMEKFGRAFRGDTVVGHDVWIGMEATIMPGVTIGDGAVVATRSVVSRDVPPYAIVAGNPARVVKMRFDEATILRLLDIAWWNWPVDKITRNIDAIGGADITGLEQAT
ncbi:antibiotic acetyltransferase [Phyllobacterium salinisoli]|uniref:Antibiotic acetyltransferase n=1 Tax=Phyllobacterium salinisoli TaxID=1899321 RepID=A0A368K832_9HYPH|nr:CatB-related O-acetyltransferase [Phyllobacterium salinisoli]RCS24785.1 antibiotic acetyltransferase [Phyllobacterium salinisoli]